MRPRRLLLEAPTAERVEFHAKELLSRALNLRAPIAFVGAGASMAYGRISWRDAVIAMQEDVIRRAREILSGVDTSPLWRPTFQLLERIKIEQGEQGDTRDLLITFQLIEQLDTALNAKVPRKDGRDFRDRLKDLLRDDYGHAQQILRNALSSDPNITLLSDPSVLTANPHEFRSVEFFNALCDRVKSAMSEDDWSGETLRLARAFALAVPERPWLLPYHRFAIGAALLLAPESARQVAAGHPVWNRLAQEPNLPLERDPLRLLRRSGFTRFLTTNYDREIDRRMEIECLIRDDGHSTNAPQDPLSRHWQVLVFNRHHVGQMLAFAARDGHRLVEVVHLHGRAEDKQDLIVTNDDYQRHYLSLNDQRAGMEDALAAAFGGNAVLFVGSGMGEDDLLRPLRQFVGDHVPGSRRLAIAIVPADRTDASRTDRTSDLEKLRNLQRYGVYTIHTGSAETPKPLRQSPDLPKRWLTRVAELRRRLDDLLNPRRSVEADDLRKDADQVLDWYCKAFGSELLTPTELEGVTTHGTPFDLALELDVIRFSIKVAEATRAAPASVSPRAANAPLWAKALRYALDGCMDSITGAFLCARLIKMERDRSLFLAEWLRLPDAEDPASVVRKAVLNRKSLNPSEPLWLRHAVILPQPLTPDSGRESGPGPVPAGPATEEPPSGAKREWRRFYAGAPSQTFNLLLGCLTQKDMQQRLYQLPPGRRLFIFIARRGVGKGHFFAALSSSVRLEQLRKAIGNGPRTPGDPVPPRWPAAFFNCGISHEVTSIFDQLPEVILQGVGQLLQDWRVSEEDPRYRKWVRLASDCDLLAQDRIGRLRYVLTQIREQQLLECGQRLIIGFNALSSLFDREGNPKNAQVRRIFAVLWGEDAAGAPIDWVLALGERRVPQLFRSKAGLPSLRDGEPGPTCDLMELEPPNPSPERAAELALRRKRIAVLPPGKEPPAGSPDQAYVHFLAPARLSVMLTAYFPSVALVLALDAGLASLAPRDAAAVGLEGTFAQWRGRVHPKQFARPTADLIRELVRGALDDPGPRETQSLDINGPKQLFPKLLAYAAVHAANGHPWHERIFLQGTGKPQFKLPTGASDDTALTDRIMSRVARDIDRRLRDLFNASGRSRYAVTVLLSAAYEDLVGIATSGTTPTSETIGDAIRNCSQFLEDAKLRLEALPEERRVEAIFELQMSKLALLDREPRALPGHFAVLRWQRLLFEMQRTLLWHLAAIGQPVVPEVLARCPLIMRFNSYFNPNATDAGTWIAIVEDCLTLLQERCLVFPVQPRSPSKPGDSHKPRYAIHRQLQRHIFRRLYAAFVEYPEADQFALSLFASQPNEMPRLTANAQSDLYRTVAALIGYPEADSANEPFPAWPLLPDPLPESSPNELRACQDTLTLRAQLLRAALGIVRSVYSLSTIARAVPASNPDHAALEELARRDGAILEQHRYLIHWMILQSKRHDGLTGKLEQAAAAQLNVDKPFYAEEIAWLYNEAGVLCYAQGRMLDSRAFFDRATAAARRLEPDDLGAIQTRIALNCALTDIERGRLTLAESALTRILDLHDEHPVVKRLAAGLLGLVDHVRGRYQSAKRYYDQALSDSAVGGIASLGLITLKRTRAASIISRYYGDMLRSQHSYKQAGLILRHSATLAIEGGHEDVRHQTRLAKLRLELAEGTESGNVRSPADGQRIHKELDVVEDFATQMGMPRLQCEVDLIRASLRQSDGDLQAAATVASRGLTVASANDLRLRKTRFLLRLADIFEQRGKLHECQAVLSEAFDLARESDYHSAREEGQVLYARMSRRRSE